MVSFVKCVWYVMVTAAIVSVKSSFADRQVAQGVAVTTTGAGIGLLFDWIPDDIGKLAALAGALLSIVLIVVHLIISRIQYRKVELEIQLLREREAARQAEQTPPTIEDEDLI